MRAIECAVAALIGVASSVMLPAMAQSNPTTIAGQVLDQRSALPVVNATIGVTQAGTQVGKGTTDGGGRYAIPGVKAGVYDVTISATGYSSSLTSDVAIAPGATTVTLNATLISAQSGTTLSVIGRTSASSRNPLAAATTISQDLSVENLSRTGQIRVADQLETLPGLEARTSSSVGDDTYVNIRGFGPSETQVLLDGHPIGPLGVLPNNGGGFNVALTPTFGLNNVDVTYGSGAQGLSEVTPWAARSISRPSAQRNVPRRRFSSRSADSVG